MPTESRVRGRTLTVTVAGVILLALAGLALYATTRPAPVLLVQPVDVVPAAPPTSGGQPSPRPRTATTGGVPVVSPQWVAHTATASGISAPAMRAYGVATLRSTADDPGCHLAWTTLAGIGWVESHQGTIGGRSLDDDGRPDRPITGVSLDGAGKVAQDLDDAAYAAARYLCASGGDLSTAAGWSAAILSYNHSDAYVRAVYDAAKTYADRTS